MAERDAPTSSGPLRFSSDSQPGLRRIRSGKGFRYLASHDTPVTDPAEIDRIAGLAIPPAWEDVWICPDPNGHIQATGRDARGRKQYRYHDRWRVARDHEKFVRMVEFGRALPRLRKRVDRDLRRRGLDRLRVLATVVRLLETTYLRIGNQEYARENRSYGLTTLRSRHVEVQGAQIRFRFRGKSGLQHDVEVTDRRLASLVSKIQELPGQELFQYLDEEGEPHAVASDDVNEYLKEASGADITAKDFRTWAGTLLAFRALRMSRAPGDTSRASQRVVRESTEVVAEALGNTPAVSRKSYIAPRVVDAFLAGDLPQDLVHATETVDLLKPRSDRREELALIRTLESTRRGGRSRTR